jgi:ubiquinone/menaquinone biosynthesis C-methylase UbiE
MTEVKNRISEVFDRTASTYDQFGPRFFSYFGERLVALARIKPGSKVLDVATGRGALLFPAANATGPSGMVVGIDLSPEMVRQTQLELRQDTAKNIIVECMDTEDLKFPDNSFDHILCGFSLFFFPALGRALAEFERVLRPGGQVAISIWGQGDTRWNWIGQVYEKFKPFFTTNPNITPTHFHEAAILETELRRAGFQNIRTDSDAADFIYADAEEWWNVQWSHVSRALLESIHPDHLDEFKKDVFQHLEAMREPDGIHQQFSAIYALAQKTLEGKTRQ